MTCWVLKDGQVAPETIQMHTGRGTQLHCYWACPKLKNFWDSVFQQVSIIVGKQIENTPELAVLNLWGPCKMAGITKGLIDQLLCAARILIPTYWKTQRIPTINEWYLKVWDLFLQDKVSMSILKAEKSFVSHTVMEKWKLLLDAASSHKIDVNLFVDHPHLDLLLHF